MKKFTIIMSILLTFTINSIAQIPNYSFENWENGALSAPDGWEDKGSNHTGFYPVTQSTDSYIGMYAIRVENKITSSDTTLGEISTSRPNNAEGFGPAFPIQNRYDNLKGYYKYDPLNGDSAQIIVYITKTGLTGEWGNLLAFGLKNMGPAVTYTPFSVGYLETSPNFLYLYPDIIPDSAYINISAYKGLDDNTSDLQPLGNSILYVDALNFDTYLVGVNEHMESVKNLKLFPNLNNGVFNVSFEIMESVFTTIKIYDVQGREIRNLFSGNLSVGNHSFHYSMGKLNNGTYLYVVATARGYSTEKICIQN